MLPEKTEQRIETVDWLRGLAALAVCWFHLTHGNRKFPEAGWVRASGALGWLGFEAFFVISGFILPYSLHRGGYTLRGFPTFLAKRVIRLDPPYLASIAITLGLWWASSLVPAFSGKGPTIIWPQLLLHLGYLNAFFGYKWYNLVYWTLAIEFQFYLLIAVLFPLLVERRAWCRVLTVGLLCATSLACDNASLVFHHMGMFTIGMATFQFRAGMLSRGTYLLLVAAMACVAGSAIGATNTIAAQVAITGAATGFVIAFVRVRPWRPMMFLGAISYSLYLMHGPFGGRVVNLAARSTHTPGTQIPLLLAALAVSIAAAWALYMCVERPAQRWASRLRYRQAAPAPAPISSPEPIIAEA